MSAATNAQESFQIPIAAAELYESAFVPAFFAQWAPILCEQAGVGRGQRVLDVACGTGIVARTAADLVAPGGTVTGVDLNEAMLAVARRVRADLEFRHGDSAALPFPDRSFDSVLCQMALMFFPDRRRALEEMRRVAVAGGTVAFLVPGALAAQAAFAPFVEMAGRVAGSDAASLLSAYFACGDLDELTRLVASSGLRLTTARSVEGLYRAPSVDAFVTTEVESTPLVQRISEATYGALRAEAHVVLAPFVTPGGAVEAPFVVNVVTCHAP